jgi:hypothetical protein
LVLSSKLLPSQCANTSVTGKGNFLETMMLAPRDWQDSWRQAGGRRLVRIARDQAILFLFHRCSPKLKFVAQQEQLIPAAVRVMTFHALSPTAGTCCRSAADSSWHAEQILDFGIDKLTVVMSPCVIRRWQIVHGESIAECTDFPVIF